MSNDYANLDFDSDDVNEAKFSKSDKPFRFNVKNDERKPNFKDKRKSKEENKTKFLNSK